MDWGDYDNDGDLDLLLTGNNGTESISHVYRNDNGVFSVDASVNLPGVSRGSVAWGDYDNDGYLDIFLAGWTGSNSISRIYRNGDGTFSDISANLPVVLDGSVTWGDYDNDGDLDILLTGAPFVSESWVYQNDRGTFTDSRAGLPKVSQSSAAWGDYDNDGDLDILLAGDTGTGFITRLYRNDGWRFAVDDSVLLPGVALGSVAWGDYDNDQDLDILLTGTADFGPISRVYRNTNARFNQVPNAPTDLTAAPDRRW